MLKMKPPEDKALTVTPQISAYLNILPISLIPTFTFPGACLFDTTRDLMGIYVAGLFVFSDVSGSYLSFRSFWFISAIY